MERNIPTQQYDGDLSVGRDLSVGGDSQLRGNATVGHNLTVKGWLEARNIKWANKGLFTSEEALKKAYPRPEKGWWAIVGKTLPGDIYVAENGAWVPTGEQGGNPSIDCQPFLEDLSALKDRMDATEAEIETLTAAVKQAEMAVVQLSELDKETVERLKSEPRRSVMMVVDEKRPCGRRGVSVCRQHGTRADTGTTHPLRDRRRRHDSRDSPFTQSQSCKCASPHVYEPRLPAY